MSDRWRRLLAVALVIESAAGFAPWISAVHPPNWYLEIPSWVYHGWSVLAMLLGILLVLRCRAVFVLAVFTMIALQLGGTIPRVLDLHLAGGYAAFLYFQVPAMLFTALGAPLLWGAARALRRNPTEPKDVRRGRIGAGLALAGFVCMVVQQAPYLYSVSRELPKFALSLPGWYGLLMSLLHLGEQILLLWGSVEMLRRISDETVGVLRMGRVHRLMVGWIVVVAATLTATGLRYYELGGGDRLVPLQLWMAAFYLTLTFVIARAEGVTA
jgi:hypothetical protein